MSLPNLFDADTRRLMGELAGLSTAPKPDPAAYRAQLAEWLEIADKRHTASELDAGGDEATQ